MQTVWLENGRIGIRDAALPERPEGFALIQVLCAGICNTDLELQRGYYGFAGVPGHEFVGKVVEADSPEWIGRTVVGEINLACGDCEWCHANLSRHCSRRTVLGIVQHPGCFASFVTLPVRNLHEVPSNLSLEEAVFVEPLAAACEILDQVEMESGARVAVVGDGKLGSLVAQVLNVHGVQLVHYGRHAEKLKISADRGIEVSTDLQRPRKHFHYVVEATGSPGGLQEAVAMTRPRGTVVLKSTVHGEVPLDTAPVIVDEISLVGSRCGRFEPALALLAKGKVDVKSLLSAEFRLKDAEQAFREAATRGVLKVLLRPEA